MAWDDVRYVLQKDRRPNHLCLFVVRTTFRPEGKSCREVCYACVAYDAVNTYRLLVGVVVAVDE